MSEKLNLKNTGNIFVDSGIFALSRWFNIKIEDIEIEHIKELSNEISKIYTMPAWKKNMYSIFPNSVLVNSAVTGDLSEIYLEELNSFIDTITPYSENGDCIACGCRNSISSFQKSKIPLTGSGALKNYFPFAEEGVDYCPLCVLLTQFSPLVMYRSGGKFILLHSNSNNVMKYWAKQSIDNIKNQILLNEYSGCFDEGLNNPTNAVFRIIQNIIFKYDERWYEDNPSLNFYYFTNYNQNPDLSIYIVPTPVFRFLTFIPQDERINWFKILKTAYKNVKWEKVESFDDYKNNPNEIYNRLLINKPIIRFFFSVKSKKALCSWNLVKYYMREVRNMEEERLVAIRNLGDNLAEYIQTNDKKKVLTSLENASNYNSFRNILRKVIKDKISNQDEKLLFTFDEYVKYLFPEGNLTWRETQDLILFRIYEKLNSWLIEKGYVDEEIDDDEEIENDEETEDE